MRTFLLLLAALSLTSNVFASNIPFGPSEQEILNALKNKQLDQTGKGVARGVWDVNGGGSQGSSSVDSGVHTMGATIPGGAVITDVYGYVQTKAVTAGESSRLSFECEDSRNLLDGQSVNMAGKAVGELFGGRALGASSTGIDGARINSFVSSIANTCNLSARVESTGSGKADFSAGKIVLFVEFVLGAY